MKKINLLKVIPLLVMLGLWTACNSGDKANTTDQKVIDEVELIESELDQAAEELDAEIEDMNHDVDSLLEGI